MKYLSYKTEGLKTPDIKNEILYIVASARASESELVRIEVTRAADSGDKNMRTVIRCLKELKTAGRIQLYATKDSFLSSSVEAQYLKNKYSDYLDQSDDDDSFVYVKI